MAENKPIILETNIVASSKIFQIEHVHLRFSNGQERHFERMRGQAHEAVMIIPMLDEETILLVREYGVGLEEYYLGLPKGTVDKGEDILAAANRELMEEIGYGAKEIKLLKSLSSSPAYTTRKMWIALATHLYPQQLQGDEPEAIEVVPWKIRELDKLLERDDFHEARSIAALFLLKHALKSKKHEYR